MSYGPIGTGKGCGIHFALADLRGTGRLDISPRVKTAWRCSSARGRNRARRITGNWIAPPVVAAPSMTLARAVYGTLACWWSAP